MCALFFLVACHCLVADLYCCPFSRPWSNTNDGDKQTIMMEVYDNKNIGSSTCMLAYSIQTQATQQSHNIQDIIFLRSNQISHAFWRSNCSMQLDRTPDGEENRSKQS
mmetsp:Transcript_27358/g.60262  ORF Transcript_27358/g.60262 Transcript_27358/m.60262 type:complete len:108 (-) Transcript_27358:63-386(-)